MIPLLVDDLDFAPILGLNSALHSVISLHVPYLSVGTTSLSSNASQPSCHLALLFFLYQRYSQNFSPPLVLVFDEMHHGPVCITTVEFSYKYF